MERKVNLLLCFLLLFSSLCGYELSVAAIFKNEGPYLKEWIEYHRMVGVEHFWLYNDQSEDEGLSILQPYIQEGVVEVIDWPVSDLAAFIARQNEAYSDALKKAKGKTAWLALIDLDEFMLPMRDRTITECLYTRFPHAAAVFMNWRLFGTGGVTTTQGEPILFRLKACSERAHSRNCIGKSIVRPECISLEDTWSPHFCVLKEGSYYFDGDGTPVRREGLEMKFDGLNHDAFIRLNHYAYRDEAFFHQIKLPRSKILGLDEEMLWEHYYAFNFSEDVEIMNFIRSKHPQKYALLWEKYDPTPPREPAMAEEKPFVTAKIYGQMGNNLFQVATACALAWDNGAEARFPDFDPASTSYQHLFFRCKRDSSEEEIEFVWNEPVYSYQPVTYHPNMQLIGYFQSEKYFAHHRSRLLELFAPSPTDLAYLHKKYHALLTHPFTVGIQIRYYKFEFPTEDIYPQYGKAYLEKAIAHFPPSTLFVVSSNNLDFARENMPSNASNVYFIENEPAYIDFFLLSLCKHNIITNSSFGWWSAWLNQNPEKIVIHPAQWIHGLPTQDVCPKEWISID